MRHDQRTRHSYPKPWSACTLVICACEHRQQLPRHHQNVLLNVIAHVFGDQAQQTQDTRGGFGTPSPADTDSRGTIMSGRAWWLHRPHGRCGWCPQCPEACKCGVVGTKRNSSAPGWWGLSAVCDTKHPLCLYQGLGYQLARCTVCIAHAMVTSRSATARQGAVLATALRGCCSAMRRTWWFGSRGATALFGLLLSTDSKRAGSQQPKPQWRPPGGRRATTALCPPSFFSGLKHYVVNMAETLNFRGSLKGHQGWVTAIATPLDPASDIVLSASRCVVIALWIQTHGSSGGHAALASREQQGGRAA